MSTFVWLFHILITFLSIEINWLGIIYSFEKFTAVTQYTGLVLCESMWVCARVYGCGLVMGTQMPMCKYVCVYICKSTMEQRWGQLEYCEKGGNVPPEVGSETTQKEKLWGASRWEKGTRTKKWVGYLTRDTEMDWEEYRKSRGFEESKVDRYVYRLRCVCFLLFFLVKEFRCEESHFSPFVFSSLFCCEWNRPPDIHFKPTCWES